MKLRMRDSPSTLYVSRVFASLSSFAIEWFSNVPVLCESVSLDVAAMKKSGKEQKVDSIFPANSHRTEAITDSTGLCKAVEALSCTSVMID